MKKSILFLLATAMLAGGALAARSFIKGSSDNLFKANVEALTQSEGGGFRPMCSQTGNTGNHYMKLCSDCSGSFGHYAMDYVAFCSN